MSFIWIHQCPGHTHNPWFTWDEKEAVESGGQQESWQIPDRGSAAIYSIWVAKVLLWNSVHFNHPHAPPPCSLYAPPVLPHAPPCLPTLLPPAPPWSPPMLSHDLPLCSPCSSPLLPACSPHQVLVKATGKALLSAPPTSASFLLTHLSLDPAGLSRPWDNYETGPPSHENEHRQDGITETAGKQSSMAFFSWSSWPRVLSLYVLENHHK